MKPLSKRKSKDNGQDAVKQLLLELQYNVKARNCLLVVENGRQMLGVEDQLNLADYLLLWQQYLNQNNVNALFLLSGIQSNPLTLNNLCLVQDKLAGLADLAQINGSVRLTFRHWYSPLGVVAERQFTLQEDDGGYLQAHAIAVESQGHAKAPAVDREAVWTLASVVEGQDCPQAWSVSVDLTQLEEVSISAVSGTIILPYLQETQIKEMARHVFALRHARGKGVKIIIREVSARMRHSQERLIRHLGATMVAPMEVSFSRLLGVIDSVRELEFDGELSDDFEQAFIMANPERKQGYLGPGVFVEQVKDLIIQTRSYGIKFAFVKLRIYRAMHIRDVLKLCHIRRPGDICTADKHCLYLFLFGCRESDIATALTFIFNMPVGQLFASEERNTTVDEALLALESLENQLLEGKLKDHSDWLASHQPHQQQPAKGGENTVFDYRQARTTFDKQPAAAAQPKPLILKKQFIEKE
jgi:cellulose biosynthesis protein BcsE